MRGAPRTVMPLYTVKICFRPRATLLKYAPDPSHGIGS